MENLNKIGPVPLYQQLKEAICLKIEKSEYKEGDRLPSIIELSALYQVSSITSRRAVSDLIAEGLLKATPSKGIFVTRAKAKDVANKTDRLIGVVFTDVVSNPFFAEVFQGAENMASASGYHLITSISENNGEKEGRLLRELKEKRIDGLIMFPVPVNRAPLADQTLKEFLRDAFPLVFIDRKIPGFSVDCVTSDNKKGGYLATSYLLRLGHHRVAFILGVNTSTVQERLAGYRKALEEYKILFDPLMIKRSYTELQYENSGYQNTLELLHLSKPPSAIFACNDAIALGVYRACHQSGIRIPDDLSVVGYDDAPFSASLIPPLTTIHQPKYEMGQKTMELLLARIQGEKSKPKEIVLKSHLVERNSCVTVKKGGTE